MTSFIPLSSFVDDFGYSFNLIQLDQLTDTEYKIRSKFETMSNLII